VSVSRFAPYTHTSHVYSVTELARFVGDVLAAEPQLRDLWVRGEVVNVSRSPAGHHYFTLKENQAQLRCVLFRGSAFNSPIMPANGLALVAHGELRFYDRFGSCELIADLLFPEGVGVGQMRWEMLNRRLEAEGLFEPSRKRPLPALPHRVGVISSEKGAVIHDLLSVLGRRFPLVEVVFLPCPVQGAGAASAMVRALSRLAAWRRDGRGVDLVVLARGGGSDEDLAAFDDEPLARAIFACPLPVVSAVGHETNLTLADRVADLRAATPSAAAELIVPDASVLRQQVLSLRQRSLGASRARLDRAHASSAVAREQLQRRMGIRLTAANDHLASESARLRALSPAATLARGYAIARVGDRIVRDASSVEPGQMLGVELHRGRLTSTVQAVEPEAND
jgi:exodeoxyribonuclease VII large subunit